jgi:uncharacterized protein
MCGIVDKLLVHVHSHQRENLCMTAEHLARPLIWVLKGVRAGDTAQAMALALHLGGRVETKQLAFTASHVLPNVFLGARVSHLTAAARLLLRPPWPDLVVATGRRTAPVALWIKKQSGARSKLVQLGRPRMALSAFDLVVTTPQYGLPPRDNVVEMLFPFAIAKTVDAETLQSFEMLWKNLPLPHVLAVIGASKFPQHLARYNLLQYAALLNRLAAGGSVVLLDSPRCPAGSLEIVRAALTVPHWTFRRGEGSNPYQAALSLCDQLVVTSDSVSMISEMLSTGKPAWIFRLHVLPLVPQWSAKEGLGARLAEAGILHPPRNVDGFVRQLLNVGMIGDLVSGVSPVVQPLDVSHHHEVVQRIKTLLLNEVQPDGRVSGGAALLR